MPRSALSIPWLAVLAVLAVAGPGCVSYDAASESALADLAAGNPDRAMRRFDDEGLTGSGFLADVEVGSLALALGDFEQAVDRLGRAAREARDMEREALVTPEKLGETLIRWALTEQVGPYRPEGYELVMLHSSLALAYLGLGMVEDARVEVRRADRVLAANEELYEKSYRAGGLGHFVSAVSYELEGRFDEALIDYRRMAEKGVGKELAGPALARYARMMGRSEAAEWEARYGPPEEVPAGSAKVVVIAGLGLGPTKREVRIDVPTGKGLVSWAVPEYVGRLQPFRRLELSVSSLAAPVPTVVLEDVAHVAKENLGDRILWLSGRSAVRNVLKLGLAEYLDDKWGSAAVAAVALFTFLTERADLRCWHTLPDTWQAARAFVPAGPTRLGLSAPGGDAIDLGNWQLLPGETVFVFARSAGPRVYARVVGGRRVADEMGRGPRPGVESEISLDQGATR